ncbi:MAG: hypothetical protein AAF628_28590 [Planctomycetota bacterium]
MTRRVFTAAVFSLLVILAASSPRAAAQEPPAEAPAPAQNPQERGIANQRARFLAGKYLEEARGLREAGRLEEALALLKRAEELTPGDQTVQNAIRSVEGQLGPQHPSSGLTYAEQMSRLWNIRQARARAEAMDRLQAAQQAIQAEKFDDAVEQLRSVTLRVQVGRDIDWGDIGTRASTLLAEAETARDEYEARQQEQAEREILQQRRQQEDAARARVEARVDGFLATAVRAFENNKFQLSQDLARQAIELDSNNHLARDIHNASTKALRDQSAERYVREKRRQFVKFIEDKQELRVPQADIMRTDPTVWDRANRRAVQALPSGAASPDDQAVREQTVEKQVPKIQFTEETGDYSEVVKSLRLITGVPILMSPEARETIDSEGLVLEIDVVSPISLANFLDFMVGRSEQLAWTVRNGVVEITTKAKAGGSNVMVSHDVRDLVFARTTFLPPVIRDIPTGDTGLTGGPRIGGEGDEKIAPIESDILQENLKSSLGGDTYWDVEGGGTMDFVETGYLLVYASPEMQQRVGKFLDDSRRFTTSVVTIETRFLTITQNFLQEIGVDFRGLGGTGNKGTEATLDDITNMLDDNASRGLDNQGTADAAGRPTAGAFFNDGGDGDVRARTENFFGSPLGQALSTNGGATAALSLLNDLELQALIQAIEKKEDINIVNSQMISVLNNERANMAVINQTSYVRDFDVEVAQAAFIADPKVDVIQDGIVLDVRPTLAHDRKHIMLSLQPTVAELSRPIPTLTTSLAGTTVPVTLQLPTLTVRTFATTASVPDGGSVLIGGLREVLSRERRAEVPLLSKIPIISFLFKQEGVADENTSLAVLVTATITDLSELAAE